MSRVDLNTSQVVSLEIVFLDSFISPPERMHWPHGNYEACVDLTSSVLIHSLQWACSRGHAEVVTVLLTAGAPLLIACSGGRVEVVTSLLTTGASIEAQTKVRSQFEVTPIGSLVGRDGCGEAFCDNIIFDYFFVNSFYLFNNLCNVIF
jgi:ankyrin repeat protein